MFRIDFFVLITLSSTYSPVLCVNKYSEEANVKFRDHFNDDPKIQIRDVDKPFRLAKLNLLWSKATLRLSEPKLKSFYSDLKLHDKEELAYKHFVASGGGDKDGLKEAELRRKLIGYLYFFDISGARLSAVIRILNVAWHLIVTYIMTAYELLEHFQDSKDLKKAKLKEVDNDDSHFDRNVFKDKKLDKLWMKAEMAGFNHIELQVLKEEFSHHREKIDQYYSLLKDVENSDENSVDEDLDRFNAIEHLEEISEVENNKKFENKVNAIRTKGREIKDGFDRLERLAAQGPNHKEFIEPKVQNLWMQAIKSNFTRDEIESLRTELHHYEKRLLKLRNLHLEAAVSKYNREKKISGEKSDDELTDLETLIKKQSRKVEKLHADLESRISPKTEL